jgi:5-methylcytosine-specific restriction endonuclease McrA
MKICTKCKEGKDVKEFGKSKFGKNGLRAICKKCHNRNGCQWQKENNAKIRERKRKRREENPELMAAKRAVQTARRKDKHSVYEKAWRKANPGKTNAKTARRRAARRNAMPKWLTEGHHQEMIKFYDEAVRLTKETGIKHEVDHIVPLQGKDRSGLHVPWNLRVITQSENRHKSRKIL